jgi:hypothetical protein
LIATVAKATATCKDDGHDLHRNCLGRRVEQARRYEGRSE